jgi:hypothetical protein
MLRKLVCAAVIVVIGFGVAVADEFRATITKIDGSKVTFKKGKKGEEGEAMTLPVTAKVKVTKGKFNPDTMKFEVGEALEKGLKNEMFTKIGENGLRATITTDADNKNITAISVAESKKKAQ